MYDRKPYLRVKIKSLAEEAKIIRNESARVSKRVRFAKTDEEKQELMDLRCRLNEHRRWTVRREARHSLLAYALIRNKPYSSLEEKCREPPSMSRVVKVAERFGAEASATEKWVSDAKGHLKQQNHSEWMYR